MSNSPHLTPKQEGWCQDYLGGMSKSEAYRANYASTNMTDKTIHQAAHELSVNPKITRRLNELRAELAKDKRVTVESISTELDEAMQLAKDNDQASAMVSAIMGKAKLHGLVIDKSKDVSEPPMSADERRAKIKLYENKKVVDLDTARTG